MPERDFDQRMEAWAAAEARAAPDLRPTEEMVRLVESRRRPVATRPAPSLRVAGPAWAALALLILSGLFIASLTTWSERTPVQQVAFVEQRTGPDAQVAAPDRGKGRGEEDLALLVLQIHRGAAGSVASIDLLAPLAGPVVLSPGDDFRLAVQAAATRMLYAFQVSPAGDYLALHPEPGFNPLVPGQTVTLPASPNWFYLSGESGEYRLILIAAPGPLVDLSALYDQYVGAADGRDRDSARQALDEEIQAFRDGDLALWELTLQLKE